MKAKLSNAMMEALCTAGRRGVYRVFGYAGTLKALERRGLVKIEEHGSGRSARATEAGLIVSAERRKTAITA